MYCREAEAAVAELASDKQHIDQVRTELEEAKARAEGEAGAARLALAQVDVQRRELETMRTELIKTQAEMVAIGRDQTRDKEALESSLREAKLRQARLEEELHRVREQATLSRVTQLDGIEKRLRATELELADTRRALESERSRRDRAIALIKPREIEGVRS